MERLIESAAMCSNLAVPLLAIWSVACLYLLGTGRQAIATQIIFFVVLLAVAGLTIRTVLADDGCWLIHTATLGALIVAGVMRKPAENELWAHHNAL